MTVYAQPGQDGSLVTFKSRYENFIGGQWVPPVKGNYFENPTPITGKTFMPRTRRHLPGARPHRPSVR